MNMHTARHLIVSLLLSLTAIAISPATAEEPQSITIGGTCTWKVGQPAGTKTRKPDFWWQHETQTQSNWVPRSGAAAAIVKKSFDDVSRDDAKAAKLSDKPISGRLMQEGTVIVFKSADGKLGKMTVVGFNPLPGPDGIRNYDIKLRWQWL